MAEEELKTVVNTGDAGADPDAGKGADPAAGGGADPNAGKGGDPNAGANAPSGDKNKDGAADPNAGKAADPADWRKEFAGDNADDMKVLERFASKADFMKSWKEQRATIAQNKASKPLPEDATPEETAEWRKANGIPEKADDYYKSLPEGMVFGEDDKPGVTKFLQDMHSLNAPPAMVSKALEVFVAAQTEAAEARTAADLEVRDSTQEALRTEWGTDYKANVNAMSAFVKANVPEADQANFLNARMGDGTPVFSHPGMVKAFAQLGRVLNPTGTATPGGGVDKLDAIETQIGAYEKRMHTKEWFKDTKAQEHYRQLVEARDNMTQKNKRAG